VFSDNNLPIFIRICLDLSVSSAIALKESNANSGNPYVAVDALARLFVLLVNDYRQSFNEGIKDASSLFNTFLSVTLLSLVNSHENDGTRFSQKAYLRIFSSILNELKDFQISLGELYHTCLASIR
jgi:hypothetical protein